eukprot:TRINITY_DN22211_c0_g1_i1.p1 TRINITY_DN22211_c0_g1~~TRINITY_DN22211_c0_g1_i1.p1  ORF type:complete len:100 (+),score=24.33 TRINITY_DN22211_c0_g1_i1:282-581(+)
MANNAEKVKEVEEEDMFAQKKDYRNPLVPVGALATAGVLVVGLWGFRHGNQMLAQYMMRARVVLQGATVALMVGSAYYGMPNTFQNKAGVPEAPGVKPT